MNRAHSEVSNRNKVTNVLVQAVFNVLSTPPHRVEDPVRNVLFCLKGQRQGHNPASLSFEKAFQLHALAALI